MTTFKARALYDFIGEPDSAEMSISAGDILTVTRTDVGEGWWEGLHQNGKSGLFPEAYVERIIESSNPPSIPPPSLPPQLNDWGDSPQTVSNFDESDDDWDNDDNYSEIGSYNNSKKESLYANEGQQSAMQQMAHQASISHNQNDFSDNNFQDNKGTITKKSLNRFSTYVKSGLESYIMGNLKDYSVPKKVYIYKENDNNIIGRWEVQSNPYTVRVTSPKKASKMGGLKSFIAYQLTPSFSNVEVSRRYKHFDWLHNRLTEKFNVIAIPPLPDKQISGRYEDQFIEHRRAQLQEFVDYMCRHPVLSSCDVWIHFLTCTDDKQWKQGKRNAEKDQLIGANFCLCIEAPAKELLASSVDPKIDESINYVTKMDQSIKALMNIALDQQKKCVAMYKREFTRIGEGFFALGSAFEANQKIFSKTSDNIKNIGTTYMTIGKLYEDQSKIDWLPLSDKMYLYKGITGSFPDILNLQKSSEQKKKECERTMMHQQSLLTEIRRRSDVVTYAVFAELNHFQTERDGAMKQAMKQFLEEQVNFYKNVVYKLEEALAKFD